MGSPLGDDGVLSGMFPFINIRRNMPVVKLQHHRAATGTSRRRSYATQCSSHPRRSLAVTRTLAGLIVLVVMAGPVLAQVEKAKQKPRPKPERLAPTAADVAYGEHPRQKFDFFKAKSDT